MGTIKSSAMGGVGFRRCIGVISCIEFVSVRNCMRKMAHRARHIFNGRETTGESSVVPAIATDPENAEKGLFPKGMSDSAAWRCAEPI
jgi:hypothetical protein